MRDSIRDFRRGYYGDINFNMRLVIVHKLDGPESDRKSGSQDSGILLSAQTECIEAFIWTGTGSETRNPGFPDSRIHLN